MRWYPYLVPVGVALALAATSTRSLPRFAAQNGAPCQTCHINPAGGGMRNEFGNFSVAFQELVIPPVKKLVEDRYRPPRISEALTVGFDVRYLVFEDGRILRMQTDAYAAIEPIEDFFYQIRISAEEGIEENYGLLYLGQHEYFARVGRFTPSHGLRLEDHTAFVRSRTGNEPFVYLDGLAIGGKLGKGYASVELFNPNDRGMLVFHAYRPGSVESLNLGYLGGFSLRFSERTAGPGPYPDNRSLFGGLSYGRFTLLGEVDFTGTRPDQLDLYTGLTAQIVPGLSLLGEYNYHDDDRNSGDGIDEFLRFSVEVFPFPFVELRPAYTYYTRGALEDEDDFFLQLHIGY